MVTLLTRLMSGLSHRDIGRLPGEKMTFLGRLKQTENRAGYKMYELIA